MVNKHYLTGECAVFDMQDMLWDIDRLSRLSTPAEENLMVLRKLYQQARDYALSRGRDVSKYPRRIGLQTKGKQIVEAVGAKK